MSEAKNITEKHRLEQWTSIIQERVKSGISVDKWCKDHGISRDSYYYYLRKVKVAITKGTGKADIPQTPKIVQLLPSPDPSESTSQETAIILKLNGITIEIKDCASDAVIERTLKALRRIC